MKVTISAFVIFGLVACTLAAPNGYMYYKPGTPGIMYVQYVQPSKSANPNGVSAFVAGQSGATGSYVNDREEDVKSLEIEAPKEGEAIGVAQSYNSESVAEAYPAEYDPEYPENDDTVVVQADPNENIEESNFEAGSQVKIDESTYEAEGQVKIEESNFDDNHKNVQVPFKEYLPAQEPARAYLPVQSTNEGSDFKSVVNEISKDEVVPAEDFEPQTDEVAVVDPQAVEPQNDEVAVESPQPADDSQSTDDAVEDPTVEVQDDIQSVVDDVKTVVEDEIKEVSDDDVKAQSDDDVKDDTVVVQANNEGKTVVDEQVPVDTPLVVNEQPPVVQEIPVVVEEEPVTPKFVPTKKTKAFRPRVLVPRRKVYYQDEEEYVPINRQVAVNPKKELVEDEPQAPLPIGGTFFPINFGGTSGGAIAIANSFSTSKGGSSKSTAVAYGSPAGKCNNCQQKCAGKC